MNASRRIKTPLYGRILHLKGTMLVGEKDYKEAINPLKEAKEILSKYRELAELISDIDKNIEICK